jgi:hypothetical protein
VGYCDFAAAVDGTVKRRYRSPLRLLPVVRSLSLIDGTLHLIACFSHDALTCTELPRASPLVALRE